ncbi:MFS transporter, partial [bacterium]|nr:MFS transporter [bacterium]
MNGNAESKNPFAGVTWYHWLVVIIASGGWLFDCMDQRIFILARSWALESVMQEQLVDNYQTDNSLLVPLAVAHVRELSKQSNEDPAWKQMAGDHTKLDEFTSKVKTQFDDSYIANDKLKRLLDTVSSGGGGPGGTFDDVKAKYYDASISDAKVKRVVGLMETDYAEIKKVHSLADVPTLPELPQSVVRDLINDMVDQYGGFATTSMILGWATGGIIFGMMSDKYGRVKTMVITLMTYSIFTGLSGTSQTWVQFVMYRFLVGLGVGGMFGAATTLVAESVPFGFRALALGSLQALSATGNIMGSMISLGIPPGEANLFMGLEGWRLLFFVGILPSILIVPIIFLLKEPEPWKEAVRRAQSGEPSHQMGTIADLFSHPRWRHHAIIGLLFGVSGMVGLWGIGFFSPELIRNALAGQPQDVVDNVRAWGTALQDCGSFCGMMVVTFIAAYLSRRLAFLFAFSLSLVITIFVFYSLRDPSDAYWMLPMMGFAQLAVFGCYSIYFPELFPTRLRGTGVGFCYNT